MKPLCTPFSRRHLVRAGSQECPPESLPSELSFESSSSSSWITIVPSQVKLADSNAPTMSHLEGDSSDSADEEQEPNGDAREHIVNGHRFKAVLLKQPSLCSQCRYFIWLFGKQAYQCRTCKLVRHKRCHELVASKCIDTDASSGIGMQAALGARRVHSFRKRTFTAPTFCDHCGSLLYGIYNQGLVCQHDNCGLTIHHKCRKNVVGACDYNRDR